MLLSVKRNMELIMAQKHLGDPCWSYEYYVSIMRKSMNTYEVSKPSLIRQTKYLYDSEKLCSHVSYACSSGPWLKCRYWLAHLSGIRISVVSLYCDLVSSLSKTSIFWRKYCVVLFGKKLLQTSKPATEFRDNLKMRYLFLFILHFIQWFLLTIQN